MKKILIVDIDGTVADLSHRRHFIETRPKDHKSFYDLLMNDEPIWTVINLVKDMMRVGASIMFVTGRPDSHRDMTIEWLQEMAGFKNFFDQFDIRMRKEGDYRQDFIVKKEILDELIADGYEVEVCLDDRQSVVNMWRQNGLTCLQVAVGDFDMPKYKQGCLTLMVGPSGAGKSFFLSGCLKKSNIISSDNIRSKICSGDFKDQSKNDQVFDILHRLVKANLDCGLDVAVDTTNLRSKDRKSLRDLCKVDTKIEYIVINRLMEDKIRDGGWRKSITMKDGKSLMQAHENTFKSNLTAILAGDNDSRVTVFDYRENK